MAAPLRTCALAASLALAGCFSVGPDYRRPAEQPVRALPGLDPARQSQAAFEADWWKQFGDPSLDALVRRAARDNLDLALAQARLRESRALLNGSRSEQIPTVGVGVGAERSIQQVPGFTDERLAIDTYQLGFDASWELDLFGGIRRTVEASRAELEASRALLQDVQVSVIAEVVRNYFELRGAQLRLDIIERDLANQRDTVRLTRARSEIGTGAEQDVASAQARLAAVEARQPVLQTLAEASRHRLAVLLGTRPGELDIDLSPGSFRPIRATLPIGGAGEVLARRPDVRAAERELAAATARIGVAKADFFPRVSLGGFFGFLAGTSRLAGSGNNFDGDFGGPASRAWSFGPSIRWEGLNVQRLRANLHASEARTDAALANYRQTVLRALEEVSNSLVAFNQQRIRVASLVEQSRQSRRAADLARVRYREGAADFLELLDAERVQLAAEDDLAQAETAINTDAVAIYKAIGGGWQACARRRADQAEAPVDRRFQMIDAYSAAVGRQGGFGHQGHPHAFADQVEGADPVAHGDADVRKPQAGALGQAMAVHRAAAGGQDEGFVHQLAQSHLRGGGAVRDGVAVRHDGHPGIAPQVERMALGRGIHHHPQVDGDAGEPGFDFFVGALQRHDLDAGMQPAEIAQQRRQQQGEHGGKAGQLDAPALQALGVLGDAADGFQRGEHLAHVLEHLLAHRRGRGLAAVAHEDLHAQ